MGTTRLDTDYLIIGAGAMGMAFADVILSEHPTARLAIVDRRDNPGGHWNDAYRFVTLHQPAAFYGLNSMRLGEGGADLASGPEVVAYYRRAMERFLATGRVQYFPMSDYEGDGRVVSLVERDRVTEVTVQRRIVDGTLMTVEVPSLRPPPYPVGPDVSLVPPSGLPQVHRPWQRYVVVGAGKTAIDAVLFLLDGGVSPDRVTWIMPNDAWLWDRASVQPGSVLKTVTAQVDSIVKATNIDEVFLRLERQGSMFRIDTGVLPSKWRCATVDRRELAELRRVEDVVRLGRVQRVDVGTIQLDGGAIDTVEDSLFIDCTANGLAKFKPRPLFSDGRINVQSVFMCQQTFSAAMIARLELMDISDERRNQICTAAPHPELTQDLPPTLLTSTQNLINSNRYIPLWLRRSRLNPAHYEALHGYLLRASNLALLQRKALASMNRMLPPAGST